MLYCDYHPESHGTGVCMRCKRVVCAACTTRVGGINHCAACLEKMGRRKPEVVKAPPGQQWLALLLAWACLLGMFLLARGALVP